MAANDALVRAIHDAPADDALRLIYADWLDERGDPLGEFIRLQLALEPLRRPALDPMAELERVRRLDKIPPGEDFPRDGWPLAQQLDRERELLKAHRHHWLGAVAGLEGPYENHFDPEFRRGFVAAAKIGLTALAEHGDRLRRACPALERLVVVGTFGRGEELAGCSGLADLPELVLAGWLTPADAAALAGSPHLRDLRALTVWLTPAGDEGVCRALARLPKLRDLTVVQMWGGIDADEPAALDRRASRAAAAARLARPDCLVRVERPFARRFPLDGVHIGRGINAGTLPSGRPVLVDEGREPVVMHFDDDGQLAREERLDLRARLLKPPACSWEDCNVEELMELLGQEIGFTPGPIFVREFWAEQSDVGLHCWGLHQEELEAPTTTDPEEGEDIGASLHWWWTTGQFELPFGNFYWADGLGRVHSS